MFIIRKLTGVQRQVLISLCCYISQLIVGISVSWTGPILPKLEDPSQSPLSVPVSDAQISLIASLLYVGAIPGPYIMGWLANVKGRKPCLIIGGIVSLISFFTLLLSKNLAFLYCGRLLAGFGIGSLGVMNLVYVGEIASKHIRGILLTIIGVFNTGGSVLMYCSGLFSSYTATTSVGLVVALAFIFCVFFIPESPMFFVLKGDDSSLKQVLGELGRSDDLEELMISKKEYENSTCKKDWLELFTDTSNRRSLIILIFANIFLQCSGIVSIVLYSGIIINMAGISLDPSIAMIIILFCQLGGSMLVPFFIEKCGRRFLMIVSCIICSFCMLILGLYFYLDSNEYPGIKSAKWLPLAVLITFFFSFDIGLGIIPSTLIGEMFKTNVRSKGSAVAITSSWISGFIVSTAFGTLMNVVGAYILFWSFSCSSAFAFIFTLLFIPETKGKSLLEIQK